MKFLAVLLVWVVAVSARSRHERSPIRPTEPAFDADLYPLIINTWGGPFSAATDAAYAAMKSQPSSSALDIVEVGCSTCEAAQCDGTVGWGGSPDESCETTLDAMIMDGDTMNVGSVANLRRVKNAIGVARYVLEYTSHTMLAGDQATDFAIQNGFKTETLSSNASLDSCHKWQAASCQPNFRVNVSPNPAKSCGPYSPNKLIPADKSAFLEPVTTSHDTISMVVIQKDLSMACGTSTNGATRKIPGRVGDGPITGSGSYVDGEIGGCGSTGSGDIMMRFLPCYQAVEFLRRGMNATTAARAAVARIVRKFPGASTEVGIFVVARDGTHGGAAYGFTGYAYSYRQGMNANRTIQVPIPPETLETLKDVMHL